MDIEGLCEEIIMREIPWDLLLRGALIDIVINEFDRGKLIL